MSNGRDAEHPADREHDPNEEAVQETASETASNKPVGLKSPQSLERLRDRVRLAAQELERLRQENRTLRDQIAELETRPAVDVDGTLLTLDDDPSVLREHIQGFIEAIDAYLAKETQ